MPKKLIGALLFLAAIGAAVYLSFAGGTKDPLLGARGSITVTGFVGGEKLGFLRNEKIIARLARKHDLTLDATKAGSIEMVRDAEIIARKPDFYWPSSQVALDIAKSGGLPMKSDEIIFNSPIVLYSWTPIAEALAAKGLAKPVLGSRIAYTVDMPRLMAMMEQKANWRDLGVDQLYGSLRMTATDPRRSNSGNQLAGLMLTLYTNEGGQSEDRAVARTAALFRQMGYLENSSGDLFDQYLREGMGSKPIIAGYENQLVEFAREHADMWTRLSADTAAIRPVLMYPEPTVFSSHVLIAMNDKGKQLITALQDAELQDMAWQMHGFRSGLASASDPAALPIAGLPATVTKVAPMPGFRLIERLMTALDETAQ